MARLEEESLGDCDPSLDHLYSDRYASSDIHCEYSVLSDIISPAFGIGLLHEFDTASPSKSVFAAAVGRWITGYCAATLWYVQSTLHQRLQQFLKTV